MGLQDRDYIKEKQSGGLRGPRTLTGWLLLANVVIAIFAWAIADRGGVPLLHALGNFNVAEGLLRFQIWRLVSYSFLHADLLHLIFNMMLLWFCGPLIERELGGRRILTFWVFCATAGALTMAVVSSIPGLLPFGIQTPMVGASAAIYGMLAGLAARLPGMRVRLFFPPVELTMRALAAISIGLSFLMMVSSSRNIGGEASHLGGALAGYFLAMRPWMLDLPNFLRPRLRLRAMDGGKSKASRHGDGTSSAPGKKTTPTRDEIDRVLDKIASHGLQSLTAAERRILEAAREDLK
ncbi:MAG: rhomboid family intramembrane serine protease [Verrucomicrobiales bacterium]